MRQTILTLATILLVGAAIEAKEPPGSRDALRDELRALELLELAAADGHAASRQKFEAAYCKLLERHPDSAEAHNAFAAFLYDHGEIARALQHWKETLKRHPGNAEAAFQFGHATLAHGETREALKFLAQAAASAEATAFQINSYANALYLFRHEAPGGQTSQAALEESLAQFERASRLEPANLDYARGYAETFFALPRPDWERARRAWARVVELTPAHADALGFSLLQAARTALRADHPRAALAYLDRLPPTRSQQLARRLRQQAETALNQKPAPSPPDPKP